MTLADIATQLGVTDVASLADEVMADLTARLLPAQQIAAVDRVAELIRARVLDGAENLTPKYLYLGKKATMDALWRKIV